MGTERFQLSWSSLTMTPPPYLRRNRLGRLSATTRSFAYPVFTSFGSPSWTLCDHPLGAIGTIHEHLIYGTLAVLVHAKTALLQVPDRPRLGGGDESLAKL